MKTILVDVTIMQCESVNVYADDGNCRVNTVSKREFLSNMKIEHRIIELDCPIKLTHEVIAKEFLNDYVILGWSLIQTYK